MEDLVICKAFISTSKDPIINKFQKKQTDSRSYVHGIQQCDQEPIWRRQVQIQQGSRLFKSIHAASDSLSKAI